MGKIKDFVNRKSKEEGYIDCRGCQNSLSLANDCCLRCIVAGIGDGRKDDIRFMSSLETAYNEDVCRILTRLSKCMNGGIMSFTEDKDCKGCRLSRTSMQEEIWSDVSSDNLVSLKEMVSRITVNCPGLQDCKERTCDAIERMADDMDIIAEDCRALACRYRGV